MCRNVEICADSTLWMQTHKVSCILGPDFFNCCGHFSLRWHVKRRVPHLLTPPVGLELKRIFLGNNTTTRLQMRIWCIPLFPSRPSSRRTWWPYGFPSRMGFGNNNSESQSTVKYDPFSLLDKDDDECSISIENFYVYTRCSVLVHFTLSDTNDSP